LLPYSARCHPAGRHLLAADEQVSGVTVGSPALTAPSGTHGHGSIRYVGVGTSSRTVRRWPCTGPTFQNRPQLAAWQQCWQQWHTPFSHLDGLAARHHRTFHLVVAGTAPFPGRDSPEPDSCNSRSTFLAITRRLGPLAAAGSPRRAACPAGTQAGRPQSGDCGLRRYAAIGRAPSQ